MLKYRLTVAKGGGDAMNETDRWVIVGSQNKNVGLVNLQ